MLAKELTKTLLLLMTVFAVVSPVVAVPVVARVTVEVPSLDVVLAIAVTSFNCKRVMISQLIDFTSYISNRKTSFDVFLPCYKGWCILLTNQNRQGRQCQQQQKLRQQPAEVDIRIHV